MSRNKNIIVYFNPNSADYKVISTFSVDHRKSRSFYLTIPKFTHWLSNADPWEAQYIEMDIHCVFKAAHAPYGKIEISIYWIGLDSDEGIRGYMQSFRMDESKLREIMNDPNPRKVLASTKRNFAQAKINISPNALAQVAKIISNKLRRRALSKALSSNFMYGSDDIVDLYVSWGYDFDFSNTGIYGGLVLHETEITGRDHRQHKKLYYSVHT
jgi:hypothetical protein